MNYNETYLKSKNAWGNKPNEMLESIIGDIPQGSNILDLGSAQGKDSLYLASLGFNITAVEKSEIANSQFDNVIKENNIANIVTVCEDISSFEIESEKYFVINIQNVLHFLEKEKSLAVINSVKNALPKNGMVLISAFTTDNTSFEAKSTSIKSHFEKQELLKLFVDFEIIFYLETKLFDKGHGGHEKPHYHGMVKIIAKK